MIKPTIGKDLVPTLRIEEGRGPGRYIDLVLSPQQMARLTTRLRTNEMIGMPEWDNAVDAMKHAGLPEPKIGDVYRFRIDFNRKD